MYAIRDLTVNKRIAIWVEIFNVENNKNMFANLACCQSFRSSQQTERTTTLPFLSHHRVVSIFSFHTQISAYDFKHIILIIIELCSLCYWCLKMMYAVMVYLFALNTFVAYKSVTVSRSLSHQTPALLRICAAANAVYTQDDIMYRFNGMEVPTNIYLTI